MVVTTVLWKPIVVAAHEYASARQSEGAEFGVEGGIWSTRVGLTVADERRQRWSRGLFDGAGQWRAPRRRHPSPIELIVEVDVVSPACTQHQSVVVADPSKRILVIDEWGIDVVLDRSRRIVSEIGVVDTTEMLERLAENFYLVEDND